MQHVTLMVCNRSIRFNIYIKKKSGNWTHISFLKGLTYETINKLNEPGEKVTYIKLPVIFKNE